MKSTPQRTETPVASPRFGPPTTANPLWRVVVASGAAFCVSCLLWITAGFGNPDAPGNQWLNRHGLRLIAVAGLATVGSALSAMVVDARQTRAMAGDSSSSVEGRGNERFELDGTSTEHDGAGHPGEHEV